MDGPVGWLDWEPDGFGVRVAVDCEKPTGAPLLLEVNSNAYFEGIERVSGVNVAGTYARYILEKTDAAKVK